VNSARQDSRAIGPMARQLSDYAVQSNFRQLPSVVVERAKMVIYDELACAYVGSELPAGKVVTRFVDAFRGVGEAAVLGTPGSRAPAVLAALANGTFGHADESDSVHSTADFLATGHPASVIVHAASAVAERQMAPGAQLINAVVLAYDVGARTVSVTGGLKRMESGHGLYAGSFHSLGAAFGCARLLGLDQTRTLHAAGLALNQGMNGYTFYAEKRHMSKALNEGQSASAGVSGAVLASMGFEATDDVFEGRGGVVQSWGEPGREAELVRDLGSEYAVMGSNFKFYCAGYPIHSSVEAVLSLKGRHGFSTPDIIRIQARLPEYPASVVSDRGMPTISLQHMVAAALVAGKLGFDEAHSATLLASPETLRLKSLIELVGDPDFEVSEPRGTYVTVHLGDGRVLEEHVSHPKGHRFREPQPGWADLREKWDELLSRRVGDARTDEFFAASSHLEDLDDVNDLVAILAHPQTG
jgi:2-methylcitrate dehydratase PrpD